MILFDLDGTLTDPKAGITRSVRYALGRLGIEEPDLDSLIGFIGPPLAESFSKQYAMTPEETARAVAFYREFFKEKGMFDNEVYPGVEELLRSLKAAGCTLVVATSKPTVFADAILQHFDLVRHFDLVVGSNLDQTRSAKTEIIACILESFPEVPIAEFVMIGDREHDIIGAHHTGIDSIAVRYGYGADEELRRANPTYMAEAVTELRDLLLSKMGRRQT